MASVIENRYNSFDHLLYPEMEKLIHQVMKNPNNEIVIPEQFLEKKYNPSSCLGKIINKVKIIILSIWLDVKSSVSSKYRKKFTQAVQKIVTAYGATNKVSNVVEKVVVSKNNNVVEKSDKEKDVKAPTTNERPNSIEQSIYEKKQQEVLQSENLSNEDAKIEPPENDMKDTVIIDSKTAIKHTSKPNKQQEESAISQPQPAINRPIQKLEQNKTVTVDVVENPEEIFKPKETVSAFVSMNKDIKQHTESEYIKKLWKTLLSNDPDIREKLSFWKCDTDGKFTARFKSPIRLWIDTSCRRGGCVFNLGDNEKYTIEGTLKKNKMEFSTGFQSYCNHKIGFFNKRVDPVMNDIHYKSNKEITMSGTYWFKTSENTSTYDEMFDEWHNKVSVIPTDYKGGYRQYLEDKL